MAAGDSNRFIEADLNFHRALAAGAGNDILLILIDSIVDVLRRQRAGIFGVAGGPERGQLHHHSLLVSVEVHDAEAARQAMRAHLEQVRKDSQAPEK